MGMVGPSGRVHVLVKILSLWSAYVSGGQVAVCHVQCCLHRVRLSLGRRRPRRSGCIDPSACRDARSGGFFLPDISLSDTHLGWLVALPTAVLERLTLGGFLTVKCDPLRHLAVEARCLFAPSLWAPAQLLSRRCWLCYMSAVRHTLFSQPGDRLLLVGRSGASRSGPVWKKK